jgi:glycine/D-amino acid oxidase-like deaminating enzyme/nitrite reductase/ring-hydroxylating ferredoxin subunit
VNQETTSLWQATSPAPKYDTLRDSVHVDVAIVGAGITGLTAAVLLKQRGKRVAVIEKDRVGSGETGNTTAHITEAIDARYHTLSRTFGKDGARLVARALRASIEQIETFVRELSIDCRFQRLPGYLYTEKRSFVAEVKREAIAAAEAGCAAKFVEDVPLPFLTRGAVRFENQAQFHPRKYLLGLAARLVGDGSFLFDETRVANINEGEPCTIECENGSLTADSVFMATNVPIEGFQSLHIKDAAYRTYAIAFVSDEKYPEGLFWDTADPYHYTRWQETDAGTFMIVGGEDHKVGQNEDSEICFARLQQYTTDLWSARPIRYRWSGQVIDPIDGLPYIGGAGKLFVSTGYSGQGITFGTLGAMIVSDLITGRDNEYADLFDWKRIRAKKQLVAENVDFPKHILADRIAQRNVDTKNLFDVKSGDGKIVVVDGRKLAVFRDEGGTLHAVSTVCTHMKCDVAWNSAEKSWDCPCHGSRYSIDGEVLNGPARAPLERVELDEP